GALLDLRRHRSAMRLALHGEFARRRPRTDATRTAVETDATHRRAVRDRLRIDVGDVDDVGDVVDFTVVVEAVASPVAAEISDAPVAEAVVDAAVVTDVQAPVAAVEYEQAIVPAPVTRRPQRADVRRKNPRARHPIVAVDRIVGPVTRRPDVTGT